MHRVFILTGAGISAPSGIQTFRGDDGLWNGHHIEDVATPYAFETNPHLVHEFYNQRRQELALVQPNAAHRALSRLFASPDIHLNLVTQNVDDLHERGGVEEVLHMHGELCKARCVDCWETIDWYSDLSMDQLCLNCNGKMRPHIVWFGETPFDLPLINRCLQSCDTFLAIGTSGMVYPASEFVQTAHAHGAETLEFNLETTAISEHFDLCVTGDVTTTIPEWVNNFLLAFEDHQGF